MVRLNFLIFLFLLIINNSILSQNKDTIFLKEVSIKSTKVNSAFAENIIIDSLVINSFTNNSLGELLDNVSSVNVKSYGTGMLSTISIRGTTSAQASVNWNGFNINNPMLGQIDFSLIPVFFADEISLQYGGNSSLWGSNSMGGTINIKNIIPSDTGISITYEKTFGSFGMKRDNIKSFVRLNRGALSVKAYNGEIKNNYPYNNIVKPNKPKEILINAAGTQTAVMPELYFIINKKQTLTLRNWVQYSTQQIPPTMLTLNKKEKQTENINRTTAEWKYFNNNNEYLLIRTAYFDEVFSYSSYFQLNKSIHHNSNYVIETEKSMHIKNISIYMMLGNTYETVNSTEYKNEVNRNISYLTVFFNKPFIKSFVFYASLRQEMYNTKLVPFVFSFNIKNQINNNLSVKVSLSKNFRYPSFNDLYWYPGGNPNLQPEKGYLEDLTMKWTKTNLLFAPELILSIYNSNIYNQIMWLPSQSNNIWEANNLAKVWSRGANINFLSQIKFANDNYVKLRIDANFNRVTSHTYGLDNNYRKYQLIYTPLFCGSYSVTYVIKKAMFGFYFHYTGTRYTTSDNSSKLNPYNCLSLNVGYKWYVINKIMLKVYLQVNNLLNAQYQVIEWRPMPPINYKTGIILNFLDKKIMV